MEIIEVPRIGTHYYVDDQGRVRTRVGGYIVGTPPEIFEQAAQARLKLVTK